MHRFSLRNIPIRWRGTHCVQVRGSWWVLSERQYQQTSVSAKLWGQSAIVSALLLLLMMLALKSFLRPPDSNIILHLLTVDVIDPLHPCQCAPNILAGF
jgi:hypothetical protein